MNAAGIIFSNLDQHTISELTVDRTLAAIPFGCRYRLVDFCLSNMINVDISNIYIVANYNYRSLVDHIGSGKDWDLARRKGGIQLIAPFLTARSSAPVQNFTHLEALCNMKEYILELKEDFVVIMDSDQVLNMDLSGVVDAHAATGADITMVTHATKPTFKCSSRRMMAASDTDGKVKHLVAARQYAEDAPETVLNIFVMRTSYLIQLLNNAEEKHLTSLIDHMLATYHKANYYTYRYDGYVASITDFQEYYEASMELTTSDAAKESLLWRKDAPVYTKVHNSAPTVYIGEGEVRDSMIADDCVIEGTVINSILSRNVHVAKGAVVKDSILYFGTTVGKGASLNCVVADKDVYITDGVTLSGNRNLPIYIEKNRKV